ncbi:hypothetical protein GCM10011405_34170 [Rufibacter glacialis]|nr:hypothetical protein GCM10011405_34170 [Rufibacter glacialis]
MVSRLLVTWGVVACLVLLLSPPNITRTYNATEAILLTPGYSPDTLQALLNKLRPRPQVFSFGQNAPKTQAVADLGTFQRENPAVKRVHVLGHGLSAEELNALAGLRMVPHLSPVPNGVLAASWPQDITLGEEVQVQGRFSGATDQNITVYLQAAGRPRDSVVVKKGQEQAFSLRFTPKATGQFVYALQWKDAQDSLHQEVLPLTVKTPRKLSLLLLSSAPSFEGKFLKNALAQQGHSVAIQNQVSKGIYQTELVNLPALALNRLTPGLLQKFDVVLLDEATLQSLGAAEKGALQQAVRTQGLGVLTTVSQKAPKPSSFFLEGDFRAIQGKQAQIGAVQWPKQAGPTAMLPLPHLLLHPKEGQEALAWHQNPRQTLALRYRKGMGQVGISLVTETFPLALEGKETLYQQYWATLLTALAKPGPSSPVSFSTTPVPFQVGQPLPFQLSVPGSDAVLVSATRNGQEAAVYGVQDEQEGASFQGQAWPQTAGWHTLRVNEKVQAPVYVHAASAWQTLHVQERQKALLRAEALKPTVAHSQKTEKEEPLSLWPIGAVLLVLLAYLWVEEKL